MSSMTIHNPDRYIVDLRQILSPGRKRIGLLIGAGAPTVSLVREKIAEHPEFMEIGKRILLAWQEADSWGVTI